MSFFRFEIPYPENPAERRKWAKEYGMNAYYAGKHWTRRKKDADYWHAITVAAMNRCGVPSAPLKGPVAVSFLWNDRLDIDNHAVMGKMIVDAMKGRILQDDSRKWVQGIEHRFHDGDCIVVEVETIGKDT